MGVNYSETLAGLQVGDNHVAHQGCLAHAGLSENSRELSVINRLIVAEKGVPVERRYSFPVGIFTREVKAPR